MTNNNGAQESIELNQTGHTLNLTELSKFFSEDRNWRVLSSQEAGNLRARVNQLQELCNERQSQINANGFTRYEDDKRVSDEKRIKNVFRSIVDTANTMQFRLLIDSTPDEVEDGGDMYEFDDVFLEDDSIES